MENYLLVDELELINEAIQDLEEQLDRELNDDLDRYTHLGAVALMNIMQSQDDYIKCIEREIDKLKEYQNKYSK